MARYTDIDKLIAEYDRVHVGAPGGARKLMVEAPIADVVPRAEVAREICCKIEEEIVAALESNYRAMREHNLKRCPGSDGLFLERIYGKIDALRGIEGFVEEIKEKYAEGEE